MYDFSFIIFFLLWRAFCITVSIFSNCRTWLEGIQHTDKEGIIDHPRDPIHADVDKHQQRARVPWRIGRMPSGGYRSLGSRSFAMPGTSVDSTSPIPSFLFTPSFHFSFVPLLQQDLQEPKRILFSVLWPLLQRHFAGPRGGVMLGHCHILLRIEGWRGKKGGKGRGLGDLWSILSPGAKRSP